MTAPRSDGGRRSTRSSGSSEFAFEPSSQGSGRAGAGRTEGGTNGQAMARATVRPRRTEQTVTLDKPGRTPDQRLRRGVDAEPEIPSARHTLRSQGARRALRRVLGKSSIWTRTSRCSWGRDGTGQGLASRALHRLGPRSRGPFITINCAGVVDALIQSALFGHGKAPSRVPTGTARRLRSARGHLAAGRGGRTSSETPATCCECRRNHFIGHASKVDVAGRLDDEREPARRSGGGSSSPGPVLPVGGRPYRDARSGCGWVTSGILFSSFPECVLRTIRQGPGRLHLGRHARPGARSPWPGNIPAS